MDINMGKLRNGSHQFASEKTLKIQRLTSDQALLRRIECFGCAGTTQERSFGEFCWASIGHGEHLTCKANNQKYGELSLNLTPIKF